MLCYNVINGFSHVLHDIPIGGIKQRYFQQPDSKLIPISHSFTKYILHQCIMYQYTNWYKNRNCYGIGIKCVFLYSSYWTSGVLFQSIQLTNTCYHANTSNCDC